MQAIIFADRLGNELLPLCEKHPPALLPIANRSLLEYTLDDIATSEIKDVFIVSSQTRQLEAQFANGEMWGIRLHYLLSKGEESPSQVITRNRILLQPPFIALRGDILRSPCCASFLKSASKLSNDVATYTLQLDGDEAGVMLVQQHLKKFERYDKLAWPLDRRADNHKTINIHDGCVYQLDSFSDYYIANMATLNADFGLQKANAYEIAPQLFVGARSNIKATSYDSGSVLVGEHSHIHSDTRLTGPGIIGHHCYVGSGASIKHSIILPGSYIGAGLQVENTIVSGHHLIRVDTNVVLNISDPEVISYVNHEVDSLLNNLPDKILASLLLLMSIPLWPIALLLSYIKSPDQPIRNITLLSNRLDPNSNDGERLKVVCQQMSTGIPLLRSLPLLRLILNGDLKLFGSTPIVVDQASTLADAQIPEWDQRYRQCRSGLLGPAQLYLSRLTSEEELRLNESFFNEQKGFVIVISRLSKAFTMLFSLRAWRTS